MTKRRGRAHVGVVLITAIDGAGKQLMEMTIPVDQYYDESHPIIDDDGYRRDRDIRLVLGKIYGPDGTLDQTFTNEYGANGQYLRGRNEFADGTIQQDSAGTPDA